MSLPALRFRHPASTPLAAAFRDELQHYLAQRGDHRLADGGSYLKALLLATAGGSAYWAALHAHGATTFVACYVLALWLLMMLAVNTLHDASHHAFFQTRAMNRVLARLVALPLGIDPDYWAERHVHFHHRFANIEHYDLDIEPNALLRQAPFQPQSARYRYQHLYWPLLAALSLPYINWVFDWADRLGRTPVAQRGVLAGARGWALFLAGKAAHFALMLWLPWQLLPGLGTGTLLLAYALGQMLASLAVVALILGTHWADVRFYRVPADGRLPHTWHEHAFYTCCDWNVSSWLSCACVGGLNLHLTHHLYPGVNHRHYPRLAQIVARLAQQHRLPYQPLNWRQLWRAQQRFLREMGRGGPPA